MTTDRTEPAFELPERQMLESWLDYHRITLAQKCDGLNDDQLRVRAVPPSSMSLLGLVRHMAEVESHWFRRILARGDVPSLFCSDNNKDGDFDDVDTASVADDLATWHAECASARDVAATLSLDECGIGRNNQRISLRWVYVHMIEEYARHNGHADFLRECIDGEVGD